MTDRILVDECLSMLLVEVAKARGLTADYVPWLGRSGMADWNVVPFALANDYVVATNNRRDYLREYAKYDIHNGLIVVVPNAPRSVQAGLFGKALEAMVGLGDEAVNKLIEVLEDGSVHVREWTSEAHALDHIDDPEWGR